MWEQQPHVRVKIKLLSWRCYTSVTLHWRDVTNFPLHYRYCVMTSLLPLPLPWALPLLLTWSLPWTLSLPILREWLIIYKLLTLPWPLPVTVIVIVTVMVMGMVMDMVIVIFLRSKFILSQVSFRIWGQTCLKKRFLGKFDNFLIKGKNSFFREFKIIWDLSPKLYILS